MIFFLQAIENIYAEYKTKATLAAAEQKKALKDQQVAQKEEKERLKSIKQQQKENGKLSKPREARAKKELQFSEEKNSNNKNLPNQTCLGCGSTFKNCKKQSEWRSCEECDHWTIVKYVPKQLWRQLIRHAAKLSYLYVIFTNLF